MNIDPHRLAFLKGVIAGLASTGELIAYSELRRLCRLSQEQLGSYLGAARKRLLEEGQPDFCAIVVGDDSGVPSEKWYDPHPGDGASYWAKEVHRAHKFWRDRRSRDNLDFKEEHGSLPAEPGLDQAFG